MLLHNTIKRKRDLPRPKQRWMGLIIRTRARALHHRDRAASAANLVWGLATPAPGWIECSRLLQELCSQILVGEQFFKIGNGLGKAVLERDVRFPVEQFVCSRNIWLALFRIILR